MKQCAILFQEKQRYCFVYLTKKGNFSGYEWFKRTKSATTHFPGQLR